MVPSHRLGVTVIIVFSGLLWAAAAGAQQTSAITGVAKDISGAVLPGVTVEASSPALIEKTRTATTDGEGRYNIVDLQPGTYTVTFVLTGFGTFKRDGIALPSGFTATVDAHSDPSALAVFDGTVWVANEGDGVLSRLPTSTPSAAGRQ